MQNILIVSLVIAPALAFPKPQSDDLFVPVVDGASKRATDRSLMLRVLLVQANLQQATHVGLESGKKIISVPSDMMKPVRSERPTIADASSFATSAPSQRFVLVTVAPVRWTQANRGNVDAHYYSSGGRHSRHSYRIRRRRSGWRLEPTIIAWGYWKVISVDGKRLRPVTPVKRVQQAEIRRR